MSNLEVVEMFSNLLGAGCGLAAGFFWVRGARAFVEVAEVPDEDGLVPFTISQRDNRGRRIDVLGTASKQSALNGIGAYWGAATAAFVAIGQLAGLFH